MRKSVVFVVSAFVVSGIGLLLASAPGGPLVAVSSLFGGERGELSRMTYDFLEDIQFKDFKTASTYHLASTQAARDIPELIRRVFGVKHELLDIERYEILEVDLDRAETRARVRALVYFRVLGDVRTREHQENDRDVEMLFYWFRQPDGGWTMELESSLR